MTRTVFTFLRNCGCTGGAGRAIFLSLFVCAVAACSRPAVTLQQDAYIWQRQWTPVLQTSLSVATSAVSHWRVLAAELEKEGRWIDVVPQVQWLAESRRGIVMVVRLNGQLARLDSKDVIDHVHQLLAAWRAQGIVVAAVEIDYDCPTSRLPDYTVWLTRLKQDLDIPLGITALPAWIGSAALPGLLAVPDTATLQVHAVMDPRQGLFDAGRARGWLKSFAQQTHKPWSVALPTYSSRVVWSEDGRIVAVESEQPRLTVGGLASELVASPQQMAAFIADLHKNTPAGMAGIVWFRLPTADDQRAWSLQTWLAVVRGQALVPSLSVKSWAARDGAPADIWLSNQGTADAVLPRMVRIDTACAQGDGINGYAMESDSRGRFLLRQQDGLLRPGQQRNIGWLRCGAADPIVFSMESTS